MKTTLLTLVAIVFCPLTMQISAQKSQPPNIGSRIELFVDDWLVERFEGDASLHLHKPLGKEVVLMNDQPWEDTTMGYVSVLKDGDTFRMYYRGHHHGGGEDARGEPMCYAESRDGIRWTKPNLGFFKFKGSAENNIVLGGGRGYASNPIRVARIPVQPRILFLKSLELFGHLRLHPSVLLPPAVIRLLGDAHVLDLAFIEMRHLMFFGARLEP